MSQIRGIKTDTGHLFIEFDDPCPEDEICISIIAIDIISGSAVQLAITKEMIGDVIEQLTEARKSLK